MAINKNFVVKNGIQVGDGLIYGDSNTGNVGVGTTLPLSKLDVKGKVNATSIDSTELFVSGISTLTTTNISTLNATTGNIVTGIVTTISGTTASYSTGNFTTGNIVTGVVTTISGTTANYANVNSTTANATTINATTGNIVTGVVTTISGTTATYSNISVGSSLTVNGILYMNGSPVGMGTTGILNVSGLTVSGVSTFNQISAGATVGTAGQILQSTGTGVTWTNPGASIGLVIALGS
jgi:hypothetical protein